MTGPRLLVSDIDGTLVRDDKTLSEGVVAAVGRLLGAGVAMSLISSRPASGMIWIAERLGLTGAIGAFNGGTILMPDGTILTAARLSTDAAQRALALVDRPGIIPWVFSAGRWHSKGVDPVHDPRERRAANQEPVFTDDFSALLHTVDKIVAVSDDHDMLAALETSVAGALCGEATVARSQPYYLDISAPAANKGDGVAALAAVAGVPLADVAVIGDQRNDMAMFARVGLSIAMGQGPAEVRAAAAHVTESNEEDGMAQAIDGILLPMVRGA